MWILILTVSLAASLLATTIYLIFYPISKRVKFTLEMIDMFVILSMIYAGEVVFVEVEFVDNKA